jgi:hypothetical protein
VDYCGLQGVRSGKLRLNTKDLWEAPRDGLLAEPGRDLVRIHPNDAVKNDRRQPVEAAGRRSGRMSGILEPHRRPAVDDPLPEVCASRKERDRGSWGVATT